MLVSHRSQDLQRLGSGSGLSAAVRSWALWSGETPCSLLGAGDQVWHGERRVSGGIFTARSRCIWPYNSSGQGWALMCCGCVPAAPDEECFRQQPNFPTGQCRCEASLGLEQIGGEAAAVPIRACSVLGLVGARGSEQPARSRALGFPVWIRQTLGRTGTGSLH